MFVNHSMNGRFERGWRLLFTSSRLSKHDRSGRIDVHVFVKLKLRRLRGLA